MPCACACDDAFLAFELDAREHLLRTHGAELEQHDQQPAEVREHAARRSLGTRARLRTGNAARRLLDRQPPVAAIERVERAAEQRAGREHRPHRQQAHHGDDADHGQVLERGAGTRRVAVGAAAGGG